MNADYTHHRLLLTGRFPFDVLKSCSVSSILYKQSDTAFDLDCPLKASNNRPELRMRRCDTQNIFAYIGSPHAVEDLYLLYVRNLECILSAHNLAKQRWKLTLLFCWIGEVPILVGATDSPS
ncbi:hypothetical protein RHSIM_Rhsim02G0055600 [Rhododendron simsii]|uniref:Uncharacterized protein n=1 Tax=Rhododendron simsii TaxID=118357 RepID=A0A834LXA0_RHOSS|nr:hypothetical protein RHSIM_Rhsim02G0055600 [Rhododendron simsii]